MTLKILGNKLVVQPLPAPAQTAGGIMLAPAYNDVTNVHVVVGVGTGRVTKYGHVVPIEVKPGDKVLLSTNWQPLHEFPDGCKLIEAEQVLATW